MTRRTILAALLAASLVACATGEARIEAVPSVAIASTPPVPPPTSVEAARPELLARADPIQVPAQPRMSADLRTTLVADHCVDRDLPAPTAADEALTVLDRSYALAASYVPPDLVPASRAGIGGSSGTKLLRAPVMEDLAAMFAASRAAGLELIIESGYRSWASQAATFDSWAARIGHAAALVRSARPGHSEHQLGTAIDLTSPGWGGRFGDWGNETAEGAWLAEHAWEYGFAMSYPVGAQDETCFSYEPWHFRWIGRAAAAEHRASCMTLREFLARSSDD
ncbi:MAG TPA: M15 family metallopeptidase [Candidatus Limnocylindria bacterium]|nr:M15 family metallopeptidase [Candidatus Limnocylindria bacterium]